MVQNIEVVGKRYSRGDFFGDDFRDALPPFTPTELPVILVADDEPHMQQDIYDGVIRHFLHLVNDLDATVTVPDHPIQWFRTPNPVVAKDFLIENWGTLVGAFVDLNYANADPANRRLNYNGVDILRDVHGAWTKLPPEQQKRRRVIICSDHNPDRIPQPRGAGYRSVMPYVRLDKDTDTSRIPATYVGKHLPDQMNGHVVNNEKSLVYVGAHIILDYLASVKR